MLKVRASILAAFIIGIMPMPALACLWDHDTLQQERSRFPAAIELITGKFLRHSKEFYEWRIQDRLRKLEHDPSNLSCYDDLSVAYQKTGQRERAIETMRAKEKVKPGLYETNANLGTFYVLSGELEEGLPYIDKALEINPHAHFDRERYQKWLVEYALSRKHEGRIQFPLRAYPDPNDYNALAAVSEGKYTFAGFLAERLKIKGRLPLAESQKAVTAVLGMMRFADYDNPLLLEALGDLLRFTEHKDDAKQLASSAYLAASYNFKGHPEEEKYRQLAKAALRMQTKNSFSNDELGLSQLESDFKAEKLEADRWYSNLRELEHHWIKSGLDADAQFDRLYTSPPSIDSRTLPLVDAVLSVPLVYWLVGTLGVLMCLWWRDRRHAKDRGKGD